jgi:hypothetical protein
MKYMLMILSDEVAEATRSPQEVSAIVEQHVRVSSQLRAAGKHVAGERLRFSPEATTLRPRDRGWVAADGPFAETREVLGGFYLIDAASQEEAIDWARKLPLDSGAIEVRPARTGAQWSGPIQGKHRFMVIFVADSDSRPSREKIFESIDRHYELSLDLAAQGKFVGSRSLSPPAEATTLRRKGGQHVVIDGPFAETKEFVAGYFVIACDSREEALEWARQLSLGADACEVRPVWEAP